MRARLPADIKRAPGLGVSVDQGSQPAVACGAGSWRQRSALDCALFDRSVECHYRLFAALGCPRADPRKRLRARRSPAGGRRKTEFLWQHPPVPLRRTEWMRRAREVGGEPWPGPLKTPTRALDRIPPLQRMIQSCGRSVTQLAVCACFRPRSRAKFSAPRTASLNLQDAFLYYDCKRANWRWERTVPAMANYASPRARRYW